MKNPYLYFWNLKYVCIQYIVFFLKNNTIYITMLNIFCKGPSIQDKGQITVITVITIYLIFLFLFFRKISVYLNQLQPNQPGY